jgi:hypothetical protein
MQGNFYVHCSSTRSKQRIEASFPVSCCSARSEECSSGITQSASVTPGALAAEHQCHISCTVFGALAAGTSQDAWCPRRYHIDYRSGSVLLCQATALHVCGCCASIQPSDNSGTFPNMQQGCEGLHAICRSAYS